MTRNPLGKFLVVLILLMGRMDMAEAAGSGKLLAPGGGEVHALIVGIDQYKGVRPLRGAVADARDVEAALRSMGAQDVVTLIDNQADRAAVLRELDSLLNKTKPGDLIVLSIAGHGAQEDERVRGSSPDGVDEVFLLVGFDPRTGPTASEKILNHEFNHYIKLFEAHGGQVIFVADTCYSGGLAREVDPRAQELSYRDTPRYTIPVDEFKPVSSAADAFLTQLDFQRTTFLAAADRLTRAPEVVIDGRYRGALSYAVARAIEGAADQLGDGKTTLAELFSYLRQLVYQLSDERQNIVTWDSPSRDPDREVVMQVGLHIGRAAEVDTSSAAPGQPNAAEVAKAKAMIPIRIASLDGRMDAFSDVVALRTPFEVVSPGDVDRPADLIWDPLTHDVVSGGDTIVRNADKLDLPGVIDRTAALRDVKQLVARSPQAIKLLPDASLHHSGGIVEVEIDGAKDRALILVDITGNGTVQLLYPMSYNRPILSADNYRAPFVVRDPFGADEVVAITSRQRMASLEQALQKLDGRRSAGQLTDIIARFGPRDARIGVVGLFTAP
jgi:hypothetical protein